MTKRHGREMRRRALQSVRNARKRTGRKIGQSGRTPPRLVMVRSYPFGPTAFLR